MRERELDERTRAVLAQEWLADALLEHASVASFARFVLDLMVVGAPAWLLERAQAAIGDEIRHARACFELATRYAGEALGPGALETGEPGRALRLEDIAAAAVREGCVGETLAALQAEAQLESALDPRVRHALAGIARDEADHAELSWAFVRWAIEVGGTSVRDAVRDAFAAAERALERSELPELHDIDRAAFAAHGRLLPGAQRACHRAAFRHVVLPCRGALLGTS
ncbi:MAG TPA: ferritin-like domain-containing protein [Polyangiaceae bacterium]|nr:ferritin-like domain-containing protein [Polyangiaceae bacterium]